MLCVWNHGGLSVSVGEPGRGRLTKSGPPSGPADPSGRGTSTLLNRGRCFITATVVGRGISVEKVIVMPDCHVNFLITQSVKSSVY